MAKPDTLLHAFLGFFFLVTIIWLLLHTCSLTFHCGASEKFTLKQDPVAYKNFNDSAFDVEAINQDMYRHPLSCPKKQTPWSDPYPRHTDPIVRENFRSVAEEFSNMFL